MHIDEGILTRSLVGEALRRELYAWVPCQGEWSEGRIEKRLTGVYSMERSFTRARRTMRRLRHGLR
jgi:hypothetical protein